MTTEHEKEQAVEVEDLTGFDVDPEEVSSAGDNFAKLRTSRDQWKARAEATESAAFRGVVLEAGFLPTSGEGLALIKALESGDVEADPGAVVTHAADEYGWRPGIVLYSRQEHIQIEAGQQQQQMMQSTTSPQIGSPQQEYETKIEEARAEGNFARASALQLQYERGR